MGVLADGQQASGTIQAHLGRALAALREDLIPEPHQESH